MMKQEKKASRSDPKGLFGREVLAETLAEIRIVKLEEVLSRTLKAMGIDAKITDSQERKLVTVFTIVIDERQRQVAIGNNVASSENPAGEVQGILRMHGLGIPSK